MGFVFEEPYHPSAPWGMVAIFFPPPEKSTENVISLLRKPCYCMTRSIEAHHARLLIIIIKIYTSIEFYNNIIHF